MTIANQIIIQAHEGKQKALKEQLNRLVTHALAQKGCQKFELYQHFETPTDFFIVEIWKSEKRYESHLQDSDYLALQEACQTLIRSQQTHALKLTQCLTKLGLKQEKKKEIE